MKLQATTLFLAGLAAAAPLAQAPPASADAARASSILSGLANGLKGSSIPLSESVSSILQGIAGGLNGQSSRTGNVDLNAITTAATQSMEKRQNRPERPPPTPADMERASGILKGLAGGMKGAFPGSDGISSILQGVGVGIGNGAKTAPTARSVEDLEKRQGTAMP